MKAIEFERKTRANFWVVFDVCVMYLCHFWSLRGLSDACWSARTYHSARMRYRIGASADPGDGPDTGGHRELVPESGLASLPLFPL